MAASPTAFYIQCKWNSSNRKNAEKPVTTSQVLGCKDICLDGRRFGFTVFTDTFYNCNWGAYIEEE